MICLDTNVVVGCLRGRPPTLAERLQQEITRDAFALPVIVLYELCYGAAKSARPKDN